MNVRRFSTGRVRGKRADRGARRYLPGGWSDDTLPVHVFLVEHPSGLCLFDTGQDARAARPGYLPRWHPFLRLARFELEPEDEAGRQLTRAGFHPGAVRWVVLSHLHTDHVGGLAPFRSAEVLVSRVEWERARGIGGRVRGYLPQRWPDGLQPSLVELRGAAVGPFGSTYDLAGDGSLLLVPLPGHTPGHLGLLARWDGAGVLCVGDAAHTAAAFAAGHPAVAGWCAKQGVRILPAHDPAGFAPAAPGGDGMRV